MKPGIYAAKDNRQGVPVRCSEFVIVTPNAYGLNVKNVDGELWLQLPYPDEEALPGAVDDELHSYVRVPTPEGAVEFSEPTAAQYAAAQLRHPLPEASTLDGRLRGLASLFGEDLV